MKITWSAVRGKKNKYESKWSFIGELSSATLQYIICHESWIIIFRILDMDTILVIIDMIDSDLWVMEKKNIDSYTSNYLLLSVSHDKIRT